MMKPNKEMTEERKKLLFRRANERKEGNIDIESMILGKTDLSSKEERLLKRAQRKARRDNMTEEEKQLDVFIKSMSNKEIKQYVFDYYDNKCSCCGETIEEFLTIDHINNDGNEHRKELETTIYRWLIENKFPDGFQLLCRNCNWGKHVNGGKCPHEEGK